MINLTDGTTGADLNFVSLSREAATESSPPTLATEGDNFDLLTKWSDTFLGVGDGVSTGTKRKSVLEGKFDVTTAQVAMELLEALTGGYRVRIPCLAGLSSARDVAASSAFGDSSDVLSFGSQFVGDWYGPTWLIFSLGFILCVSRNATRIAMRSDALEADPSCALPAMMTAAFHVGMMTLLLTFFCRGVVRDPTFFGSNVQRLKFYSIAGYSAAPLAAALLVDSLFLGILGLRRNGLLHWLAVYGVSGVVAALYIRARFPLAAIGAFAPSFDPAKARLLFWLGFCAITALTVFIVQLFFVV